MKLFEEYVSIGSGKAQGLPLGFFIYNADISMQIRYDLDPGYSVAFRTRVGQQTRLMVCATNSQGWIQECGPHTLLRFSRFFGSEV